MQPASSGYRMEVRRRKQTLIDRNVRSGMMSAPLGGIRQLGRANRSGHTGGSHGPFAKILSAVCAVSTVPGLGSPRCHLPWRLQAGGAVCNPLRAQFRSQGQGRTLEFVPDTLTVPIVSGNHCKTTNYQFSITNKTQRARTITHDGTPFIKVPPGHKQVFCAWNVGTQIFGVHGTAATLLTVNSTPR